MMKERDDHAVFHEPFTTLRKFGSITIEGVSIYSQRMLICALQRLAERRRVFFKEVVLPGYPRLPLDQDFLCGATHTFLIRDPRAVLASHFAMNNNLQCERVGFDLLCKIYDSVAVTGRQPIVISSDDIVAYPETYIRAYCAAVGIPFLSSALTWQPMTLPEWDELSIHWRESTRRSAGFTDLRSRYPDTVENNSILAKYLEYHEPFYRRLNGCRLGAI
jgi:hypothetical protein